jgi:YD repeat-containing protein
MVAMTKRTRKAYWRVRDREGISWRFTWDPKAQSLSMRMPRGLDYRITSEELVAALFMCGPDRRTKGQRERDSRQLHLFDVCSPTPDHRNA